MNLCRPVPLIVALAACCVLFTDSASAQGRQRPVHGDLNCNSEIDAGDALHLLVDLSGQNGPRSAPNCGEPQGDNPHADLDCDGLVGMGDVIALVRAVGGLSPGDPDCPAPGDDIGAPLMTLECENADEPLKVECRYSIWKAEHEIESSVETDGGEIIRVFPASGVVCAPNQGPCEYSFAATIWIAFDGPGGRQVSVSGCDDDACATRSVAVWV